VVGRAARRGRAAPHVARRRRAADIGAERGAADGTGDGRCGAAAAATDLVAEDAAEDAADDGAADVRAGRGLRDLLALDPAAALRRPDDGVHVAHRRLEEPFVRPLAVLVYGLRRWRRRRLDADTLARDRP